MSGEDVIGLAELNLGFSDLSITDTNNGALINASNSDLAVLQGVDAASLSESDFAFG